MKHSSDTSNCASSRKRYSDEDAQAAVIFLLVVGMIAVLAVYIWTGPIMDEFTGFHNNATQGTATKAAFLELSQERQDSIFVTQVVYRDFPILFFVLLPVAAYIAALRWRSGSA